MLNMHCPTDCMLHAIDCLQLGNKKLVRTERCTSLAVLRTCAALTTNAPHKQPMRRTDTPVRRTNIPVRRTNTPMRHTNTPMRHRYQPCACAAMFSLLWRLN